MTHYMSLQSSRVAAVKERTPFLMTFIRRQPKVATPEEIAAVSQTTVQKMRRIIHVSYRRALQAFLLERCYIDKKVVMSAKIFKPDSRISYPIQIILRQESAFTNYLFVENS